MSDLFVAYDPAKEPGDRLAPEVVDEIQIIAQAGVDSVVGSADLEDGAVTTAKIADLAVTDAKLASNSVTTSKIAGNAISSDKLGPGSVTPAKAAPGIVTSEDVVGNDLEMVVVPITAEQYAALPEKDPNTLYLITDGNSSVEVPGGGGGGGGTGTVGPQGPAGPAGAAATIAVGSTTTGAAGSSAAVTNSGSSSAAVFDFVIPRGETGQTGLQGAPGLGIKYRGEVQSLNELNAITGQVQGDLWVIGNRDDDTQPAESYIWDETQADWLYGGRIQGPQGVPGKDGADSTVPGPAGSDGAPGADGAPGSPGEKGDRGDPGDTGAAATIAVGTTTTGAAGAAASVSNTGTSSAAVFDFVIPAGVAGADGAPGADGADGAPGPTAVSADADNASTLGTDGLIYTPLGGGAVGPQGPAGPEGPAGPAGSLTVGSLPEKNPPVDADAFVIGDSAAASATKKLSWLNLKNAMGTWYDSATRNLTNKTISGKTNTVFNLPASATPDAGRLVHTTAVGSETNAGYWAKVLSWNPGLNANIDIQIVLGVSTTQAASGHNSAILSLYFRHSDATGPTAPAIEMLALGGAGEQFESLNADEFDARELVGAPGSFKVIGDETTDTFELWMRKGGRYGQFCFWELSRAGYQTGLTYNATSAWQAAEPVGVDWNVYSAGVTVGGVPVVTTTGEQELTGKVIDCDKNTLLNLQEAGQYTTFYDDFTGKPDGPLSPGDLSDSGHTYTVFARPLNWVIKDGALTHVPTSTSQSQSSYLGVNLGVEPEDKIGYIWADFQVPVGAGTALESLVLVASVDEFTNPDQLYSDCAAHCIFSETALRYDKLKRVEPSPTTVPLGRGQYNQLLPGTYRVAITIDGQIATITAPDGKRWGAQPDPDVIAWNGPWASIQLNSNSGARSQLRILRWGAELQSRSGRGAYASNSDASRLAIAPGRLLGAVQTDATTSTVVPITTALSAKLVGVPLFVPPSRRILCEGVLWFDEFVPVTKTASTLAVGVFPDGVSTYGKLSTVVSGFTPANSSADGAASTDRQGTMTTYSNGRLVSFSVILDLDPAFQVGGVIEFQIKAQANAAGLWSFVHSGNGSGFGGVRKSTVKVTELPALPAVAATFAPQLSQWYTPAPDTPIDVPWVTGASFVDVIMIGGGAGGTGTGVAGNAQKGGGAGPWQGKTYPRVDGALMYDSVKLSCQSSAGSDGAGGGNFSTEAADGSYVKVTPYQGTTSGAWVTTDRGYDKTAPNRNGGNVEPSFTFKGRNYTVASYGAGAGQGGASSNKNGGDGAAPGGGGQSADDGGLTGYEGGDGAHGAVQLYWY